ncbi:MAG TPA: hypothetical protein PK787_10580 [Burkholderiaceae bacterium]|jgi:hypothetical protein|nr:hypothetical protein [Burkholderiaceae bacterium]
MDRSFEAVEAEAMRLSGRERAALAGRLIETLAPHERPSRGVDAAGHGRSDDHPVGLVERLRQAGF